MKVPDRIPVPGNPITNPINKDLLDKMLNMKLGLVEVIGLALSLFAACIFYSPDLTTDKIETIKENKKENSEPINVTS